MKALLPELQEAGSFYIFAIRALHLFKLLVKVLCCSYGEHRNLHKCFCMYKTSKFLHQMRTCSAVTPSTVERIRFFSAGWRNGTVAPSPISKLAL